MIKMIMPITSEFEGVYIRGKLFRKGLKSDEAHTQWPMNGCIIRGRQPRTGWYQPRYSRGWLEYKLPRLREPPLRVQRLCHRRNLREDARIYSALYPQVVGDETFSNANLRLGARKGGVERQQWATKELIRIVEASEKKVIINITWVPIWTAALLL